MAHKNVIRECIYKSLALVFVIMLTACQAKSADDVVNLCISNDIEAEKFLSTIADLAEDESIKLFDQGMYQKNLSKSAPNPAFQDYTPEGVPIWLFLRAKNKKVPLMATNFGLYKNSVNTSFFYYPNTNWNEEFSEKTKLILQKSGFSFVESPDMCGERKTPVNRPVM